MRLIVYNPRGGAAIRDFRLRRALRELQRGPCATLVVATAAHDMSEPVRRALREHPEVDHVVACGGDGTVAACAAAVGEADIPIGIVPTGTTNVLAYELGLPASAVAAARMLGSAMRRVPFRTWSVNGLPMLLQLGVGFDGRLIWRTPRRVKRALGFAGVVLSALHHGVWFDYPELRVTGQQADGSSFSAVCTSVMVANATRWAGSPVTIPAADPGDDVCDLLILDYRHFGQLAAFWLAILLPGAPHLRFPFVRHVRARGVRIEALGRAVEAHIDGEPLVTTPLSVAPLGRVTLLGAPPA
jgi:diacylglycerol kinase (ATP)